MTSSPTLLTRLGSAGMTLRTLGKAGVIRPYPPSTLARLGKALKEWGTGPAGGTAMYAAAKVVEAAGLPAYAQDLEEYWHIERFADPADAPLVVLAPPGLGHPRAAELAAAATGRGRRVIAVTGPDDTALTGTAWHTVPVTGTT